MALIKQAELEANWTRKTDFGVALLMGLTSWVVGVGMDQLFRLLFKEHDSRSSVVSLTSLAFMGACCGFMHWKKLSPYEKPKVVTGILASFVAMILVSIPERVDSVRGFLFCIPAMAIAVYMITPVLRMTRAYEEQCQLKLPAKPDESGDPGAAE